MIHNILTIWTVLSIIMIFCLMDDSVDRMSLKDITFGQYTFLCFLFGPIGWAFFVISMIFVVIAFIWEKLGKKDDTP